MNWLYYEYDDRMFRALKGNLGRSMEHRDKAGEWRPYAGDWARVLFNGVRLAEPDPFVPSDEEPASPGEDEVWPDDEDEDEDEDEALALGASINDEVKDVINLPDISSVSGPSMVGAIPSKPKRKRKKHTHKDVTLGRAPTDFEVHVLSLSAIPKRMDAEVEAVVLALAEVRRGYLREGARMAPAAALDAMVAILHTAQDAVTRYGAFEVRQECERQGLQLRVATDEYRYVRQPQDLEALAESAEATALHLHNEWASILKRLGIRTARGRNAAAMVELAEPKITWGLKTPVRALLNEGFAKARRSQMATICLAVATDDDEILSLAAAEEEAGAAGRRTPAPTSRATRARRATRRAQHEIDDEEAEKLVDYVIQTAIMDTNTCSPCEQADGLTFDYGDDAMLEHEPPYYRCLGGDNCRCVQVYVLKRNRTRGRDKGGAWVVRADV